MNKELMKNINERLIYSRELGINHQNRLNIHDELVDKLISITNILQDQIDELKIAIKKRNELPSYSSTNWL